MGGVQYLIANSSELLCLTDDICNVHLKFILKFRIKSRTSGVLVMYFEQGGGAVFNLLAMFVAYSIAGFGHVSTFSYRRLPQQKIVVCNL